MPRKRHKAEEIVTKLRQVEALTAQGRWIAEDRILRFQRDLRAE